MVGEGGGGDPTAADKAKAAKKRSAAAIEAEWYDIDDDFIIDGENPFHLIPTFYRLDPHILST